MVGGPILMAAIATFHILPSHVAIGAFWITYFIERKALRENRPELLEFLKKLSLSILIFCFVTGSLTGVGIWFAATVISPRAISGLIHTYVWGWATEWVFFVIEIVAIYVYYYTFDKIDPKLHLRIGLIYAIAAWLSMVIITGILGFMLTPGDWLETGNFFHGFFNPTYWPQLFFRTAMMFAIAGCYAALVAATLNNGGRDTVRRIAGRWGLVGIILAGLFATWYYQVLPENAIENMKSISYVDIMLKLSIVIAVLMAGYFLLLASGKGWFVNAWLGVGMMVVLLAGVVGGESVREFIRRPYLIPGYMYSNQIIGHSHVAKGIPSEAEKFNREGLLANYHFAPAELTPITIHNFLAAGEVLVKLECLACHTLTKGGRNSLPDILEGLDAETAFYLLDDLSRSYMPPFAGNDTEKRAAAAYIAVISGGDLPTGSWVTDGE
jgi:cytochrome bd-type quinol oxidase subunit 1